MLSENGDCMKYLKRLYLMSAMPFISIYFMVAFTISIFKGEHDNQDWSFWS